MIPYKVDITVWWQERLFTMVETACLQNESGYLVGYNKIVYQIMYGMDSNNSIH